MMTIKMMEALIRDKTELHEHYSAGLIAQLDEVKIELRSTLPTKYEALCAADPEGI